MVGARKPTTAAGAGGDYAYVEVMACPGGCTNGGGQIKVEDVGALQEGVYADEEENGSGSSSRKKKGQKEWLSMVDEAYYPMSSSSSSSSNEEDEEKEQQRRTTGDDVLKSPVEDPSIRHDENDDDNDENNPIMINGISPQFIKSILTHWSRITGIDLKKLVYTSYRNVESEVGKGGGGGGGQGRETERVVEMASKIGGGW